MPIFSDFIARLAVLLQDGGGKLAAADREDLVRHVLAQRYSKDRPREIVSDSNGNGTSDLALPSSGAENFEEGFSILRQIEYPVGDVPPTLLEQDAWQLYRKPTGLVVRLNDAQPAAAETIRFTWTLRHKSDGSTVFLSDFEAVCDYAGALAFDALAARYVQLGDSTIGADAVNYRTKSQEYASLASKLRKRYFEHMGIAEGSQGASAAGPAIAMGDLEQTMGSGVERMTHRKR